MNHVYHYYAFRQQQSFERTEMDGVLILQRRIDGVDGFKLAKQLVAEFNEVPLKGLVLAGLNYLGESVAASAPETRVSHTVTCKKFPDPHDERDPVGPCTCGAESKPAPEHVEGEDCWCHPTLDYTNPETGVQHWIHHEPM